MAKPLGDIGGMQTPRCYHNVAVVSVQFFNDEHKNRAHEAKTAQKLDSKLGGKRVPLYLYNPENV